MSKDRSVIRELACQYFEIANSDENRKSVLQHRAINDLKGGRPIVFISEIPWHEMDIDGELTLVCEDPFYRSLEDYFRKTLYQWRHMRGDMAVTPYFGVRKVIHSTGTGLQLMHNEHDQSAQAYTFVDQLSAEADLEKIQNETISYDREATMASFCRHAEAFGDIVPVRIVGEDTGYGLGCKTIDDVVFLRGLDTFFTDLIERPEFMHKLIGRLTDVFLDKIRQYNELGLFNGDAYFLHSTAAQSGDLHPNYEHTTSDGVWGRGLAQIFASVSPAMHDEFDIQYMIRAMEPFGLCYYGCCEPLDKKVDILAQIPNLRKISITPWADIRHAAEVIGTRYVISSKTNPAFLATPDFDEEVIREELTTIVRACRANNCCADIAMKDLTTVRCKPQNLFRWHDIAMEVVNEF